MSAQDNAETIRRLMTSFEDDESEHFFSVWDDDVVLEQQEGYPNAGVARGIDAVRASVARLVPFIKHALIHEITANEDCVMVLLTHNWNDEGWRAKGLEPPRPMQCIEYFRFRGGKIVEIRPFGWDPRSLPPTSA